MKTLLRTFPLTLFCVALIWYLCLFKPPSMKIHTFHAFDKLVHVSMYLGTCSVFWWEYLRSRQQWASRKLYTWAVIAPILMSAGVEVAQEYLTDYRSGDVLDFVANTLGVLLALPVAWALRKYLNRP